ncbi:regulator of chromosome condensation 1/beta-lactamase-inhibitor protein II [Mycena sp. CBHHK59/15]|nr:regulator of chromosome condensation 1/beta-lactamase-inhibitor protein II [Mycena sp. CBHHK59/15]
MFTGKSWRPPIRAFHHGPYAGAAQTRPGLLVSSALLASALWYSHVVYNDGPVSLAPQQKKFERPTGEAFSKIDSNDSNILNTLVWGSNRANILSSILPSSTTIRKPFVASWLDNVALRDLVLHQSHAACVDARGDVYQWGKGYLPRTLEDEKPKRTLSGKDIIKLQLSDRRVFALAKSGKVYVLDSNAARQTVSEASAPRWKFWASTPLVDSTELAPQETFGWGEKFVSISAGRDHLLALTSTGHSHGQLGFRPTPTNTVNSLAGAVSPATGIDERDIRACTRLYELPVLKDVKVAQIAAGARSSFVRTPSGQQLGLGASISSDFVTVPTEVGLRPTRSQQSSARCLDVSAGGDLTCFTVERTQADLPVVDVLMCGDGQWGGIGNSVYTNAQGSPTRVKMLSGLFEHNEATQRLQSIRPQSISISPTGHVLATLNPSSGGCDLHVWGRNQDYELGNGKKTSVSSPMPVGSGNERLLLQKRNVKDLQGRTWGRGTAVEQFAVCGFGCSIVYWRLPLS